MKNKVLIYTLSLLGVLASSCGDKEVEEIEDFTGIYYDERTSDREYFENVGSSFLRYIAPAEQGAAIVALDRLVEKLETYEMPESFFEKGLVSSVRSLIKDAESGDYSGMSRAASDMAIYLSKFKGLYQASPNEDSWRFYEDREDLMLKYWIGETEHNLVISTNGSEWTTSIVDIDGHKYMLNVPQLIDLTLSSREKNTNTNLITLKLQSDMSEASSISVTTSLRFANIQVESTTKGNNSKIREDMTVYHHNPTTLFRTLLLSSTAEISGNNLCSLNSWYNAAVSENEVEIANMLSNASATIMVFKSIQIKYNITDVRSLISNVDAWYSTDYDADPKGDAERSAKALEKATSAELRYSGDKPDKVRATLGWEAYMYDDYNDWQGWAVRPTITFASDGSTYDIASYFGNKRFLSIETTINNALKKYASYITKR